MTPDKLLDEYYKPKMHWQGVNRINVIAAMNEYSANNVEGQLNRLYEWIKSDNRKSADTAFTSGVMRNIAREFELLISEQNDKRSVATTAK